MSFSSELVFDYKQLHLEISGPERGKPVLLLHGWGSCAANMRNIAYALDQTHRVFNLDLPGHGQSPAPSKAMGIPEHAALIHRLIEDNTSSPVTIIGHSNGGRIALYMAADPGYSRLIRNLVLVSPSGIAPIRTWKYYARIGLAKTLKAPFSILPGRLRDLGLDWLRHSLVWRILGSSDYRSLDGVMRETFVKTVNCHLDDIVDRITIPALLFWGDRDEAVTRRQMDILEKNIPDAGLIVLKHAGHFGYLDDFETFIAATRHFLEVS